MKSSLSKKKNFNLISKVRSNPSMTQSSRHLFLLNSTYATSAKAKEMSSKSPLINCVPFAKGKEHLMSTTNISKDCTNYSSTEKAPSKRMKNPLKSLS